MPGTPCTPEGDHVARFGRAMRRGLISGPDLLAVLGTLDAFTTATVICDAPDGVAMSRRGSARAGASSRRTSPGRARATATCGGRTRAAWC